MKYSFVTIAYEEDYPLLLLQAKSMSLYCNPELVEEIIVVENFTPGKEIDWRPNLLMKYGNLAYLVRFVPSKQIAALDSVAYGWFSQQILKLKVASVVKSKRYVVLDAKNHLVRPLNRFFLETNEGKIKINGYSYDTHPLLRHLRPTLDYFNLPEKHIQHFTRTSTPFTMVTNVSKAVVKYVERREQQPIEEVFLKLQFAEFFLYSSFLISVGCMDEVYEWSQPFCGELWRGDASVEAIERITQSQNGGPFLAIHRATIPLMDDAGQAELAKFWREKQLFNSVDSGIQYLKTGDISTL